MVVSYERANAVASEFALSLGDPFFSAKLRNRKYDRMLAPVEFRMRQKMRCLFGHRLADGMAIASACLFTFRAAYRIQLPGL